jgi:Ser-tRNA(Ala) deacylase AlaX
MLGVAVDLLYLRDAYLTAFTATVTSIDDMRVSLDRTAFYPTGGGQPHDTGTIGNAQVVDVRKEGDPVWHTLAEGAIPRTSVMTSWARSTGTGAMN